MTSKTKQHLINNLFILFLFISGCSEQFSKYHLRRGEAYWRNGNSFSAIKELKKALKYEPTIELKDKTLLLLSTISEGSSGDPQTALWALQERLQLPISTEKRYEIYLTMAEIYANNLKNYLHAIETYKEIISLIPNNEKEPDIRIEIAKNYVRLGEYKDAETEFQKILSLFPDSKKAQSAMYQLGMLAYLQGKCENGRKYFNAAISKYPTDEINFYAWLGIGSCYEEEDDLRKAISTYKSIKQKFPDKGVIDQRIITLEKRIQKRGR